MPDMLLNPLIDKSVLIIILRCKFLFHFFQDEETKAKDLKETFTKLGSE